MYNYSKLTIIIVTFLTDKQTLLNCLRSIDQRIKVIIIENSSKFKYQDFFQDKFKNLQIFCTGNNLGYGGGNNYGLEKVESDCALILNPDTVLDNSFFNNLNPILDNNDFSIIGCELADNKDYVTGGFFDKKQNQVFRDEFFKRERNDLTKVDWVTGSSMVLNLKKIKSKKIFDENFFLYFEEFDLCQRLKKQKQNVFLCKSLKIHHLGFKSSNHVDPSFKDEAEKLRNWHWMWSQYYYYKKNYSFIQVFIKSILRLLNSSCKALFYQIIFDQKSKNKYLYRSLGLLFSMMGCRSSYRGKFFN